MKTLRVKVKGIGRMLQHNGLMAAPTSEGARALKELTGKRKKSDSDYEALADVEALWGMYRDENGAITVEPTVIEANLIAGAKSLRKGDLAKSGILAAQDVKFDFAGIKDAQKRATNPKFRATMMVGVQKSRVARTRPCFDDWTLEYDLIIDETVINPRDVAQVLQAAGAKGIGDYRPRYGRYLVESVDEVV